MKAKIVLIGLFLFSFFAVGILHAERVEISPGIDDIDVFVEESSDQRTVLRFEINAFSRETVNINAQQYYSIACGEEYISLNTGEPALPRISRSIIIPDNAKMQINVLSANYIDYPGMKIIPSKGNLFRTVNPDDVPYTFGPVYAESAFYPDELTRIRPPFILRDYRGTVVELYAFQCNPVESILRVYNSVTVEIKNVGPGEINVFNRSRNAIHLVPDFKQLYERQFINYDSYKTRYTSVDEIGEMLIITYDAYASDMAPFVEWKNQKGVKATIVNVSTIGNNSTNIKNYVQSFYNANDLAFLLLVGDAQYVATPSAYGGESDPTYALLAGSDYYPDIFVGRFSAESSTDVQTQVERTIDYEKTPSGVDWFHKGTGIASNGGPGHYGEYDYQHMDLIRNDLLGYNYTLVDQIYEPGGTALQVSAALNSGRGIVNYCGHGTVTSWWTTGFSNSDINNLTNQDMLPFIHSVACVNGDFGGQTCFAEAWLRATYNGHPSGALAVYMSSINQHWYPPMYAQDETIDLLIAESKLTFGGLCFNGACKMIEINGDTGIDMYYTWHVFGDPSVQVRTDNPEPLTVNHETQIFYQATQFQVEVVGVEGAFCTLYHNGVIYGSEYTDANGIAIIPISQQMPGGEYLTLTVTAFNKETVQDDVEVIAVSPPEADFSADPLCGCPPLYVSFYDQSTGDIDEWWWNFGDGGKADPPNPFYTYYDVGNYTVSLEVIGPGGSDIETKPDYIQVLGGPTADFTASPTSGEGPLTVDFTDLSVGANAWSWNFGDGGTSTDQNPTHIYASYGDFDVSLQVSGLCGTDSETKTSYISISMPGMTLFDNPEYYSNGGNAKSVTADDFDGDGDIDLAVATYYPEYAAVYLNDGSGNFSSGGNYPCGDSPGFITSADFDENGYPDLAVANPIKWQGGYVSILYNDGYSFYYSYDFYTGAWYPYSIATGDFDNDNDTDMAVVQYDGNNVVLFYNNYGGFSTDTAIFPIVGYSPKSIVAGDFDNDNDLDLATADYSNISILLNNGDGTFPASVEYPTSGSEGRYICAGDFDGDFDVDLAVTSTTSDNVSVLLNNGDGTFATAALYDICNEPYAVAADDFDGDGTLDLVIANSNCTSASVLLNAGNGAFGEAAEYYVGGGSNGVVSADFDGDNDNDLALTGGYTSNNLVILFNNSDVLPAAPALVSPTEGSSTTDHTPNLDWEDVTGATSYDVILDDDEDFSSISRSRIGLSISQWEVTPSLTDGNYSFKARAKNAYGFGPWSQANRFNIYTNHGNPSCPVLYAFDGNSFNQDNPLLTACEQTNYTETVTDYYHVMKPVVPQDGAVKFQLREMEDEITYLQDIELITVDHSATTKVAVSVDGDIGLYSDIIAPISAVDNKGVNRLPEILNEDGNFYSCEDAGCLIITFPCNGSSTATFGFSAKDKELCPRLKKENGENGNVPLAGFKVEIMDTYGNWIEGPIVPSRVNHTQEMVTSTLPINDDQTEIKIRISWESGYYTDVVQQYVPSNELPRINELEVNEHALVESTDPAKTSAAFDNPDPLVLVKGDVFEFNFTVPEQPVPDLIREYIIRAVGRYIPDYSKFKHLLPTEVQLYSNYPNPFNPSTKIEYFLPQKSNVRLEIYNILGRRVNTLVDGPVDAGMNSVIWNSTDQGGNQVASGVYLYRLTVGNKVESKRMLLIK